MARSKIFCQGRKHDQVAVECFPGKCLNMGKTMKDFRNENAIRLTFETFFVATEHEGLH